MGLCYLRRVSSTRFKAYTTLDFSTRSKLFRKTRKQTAFMLRYALLQCTNDDNNIVAKLVIINVLKLYINVHMYMYTLIVVELNVTVAHY